MGFIGSLLGTQGGAAGTGFAGPQGTNIQNPSTTAQANTAYGQTQQGLAQQQAFLQALQGQNGIGNQSSVFNQLQGVASGTGPNPAQAQLAQATGANTANQAALMAGQRGAGSNVGLMARQAAQQGASNQQNSAGQAATMQANQSLNALNNMGNLATQQVGQQANANQVYNQAAQGQQANLLNGIQGQNNANVSMQSNINNVNGQLANTQMQGQQSLLGGAMQGLSSVSGMAGAAAGARGGMVKMADGGDLDSDSPAQTAPDAAGGVEQPEAIPPPATPTPMAAPAAPASGGFATGVNGGSAPSQATPSYGADSGAAALSKGMSGMANPMGSSSGGGGGGMSSMLPMLAMMFQGGKVKMADGGIAAPDAPSSRASQWLNSQVQGGSAPGQGSPSYGTDSGASGLQQGTAKATQTAKKGLQGQQGNDAPEAVPSMQADAGITTDAPPAMGMMAAHGGRVPALVSPGERYLPPKAVKEVASGKKSPMKAGEKIPGKPKVAGAKNSYANDTVPKTLKEGGIVLPRSVTQSKDPAAAAHAFVSAVLAKRPRK